VERGLAQSSFALEGEYEDANEFGGEHEGGRPGGLPVLPSRGLLLGRGHVEAHGPLHEPPDHESENEHEAEGFDTAGRFQEQSVYKDGILEKREILLRVCWSL